MFGFLNINKPSGITSSKVVYILRKVLNIKQIGHCGTLDPLASGVLPIAIGKATRLIEYLPNDKQYVATFELGKKSDTYDIEGDVVEVENFDFSKIDEEKITSVLNRFVGEILQEVPAFSAVKVKGQKLYNLARKGVAIEKLPQKTIYIDDIKLLNYNETQKTGQFIVTCKKGVYVRSIINDLGNYLGCGAIMTNLKRTISNGFNIENSICDFENFETLKNSIINPLDILPYEALNLNECEARKIKFGQTIEKYGLKCNNKILMLNYNEKLQAMGKLVDGKIELEKVFIWKKYLNFYLLY